MTAPPLRLLALALAACAPAVAPPAGGRAPAAPAVSPPAQAPAPPVEPAPRPVTPSPAGPGAGSGEISAPALRTLGSWTMSPYLTSERRVIRTREVLAEVWSRLGEGPVPAVDFERGEVAVLAAMGQQPSGGHAIQVQDAEYDEGVIRLIVVETTPDTTCLTTGALTQPATLVAVGGAAGAQWQFVERRERSEC